MSQMTRVRPFLALVVMVLGSGCTLSAAEETVEQTVDLPSGSAVKVETRNGGIKVVESRAGKVRITATKRARATSGPRKLLSQIKVVVKQKGGTLYVTAEHPTGSLTKQYGVSFDLTVPKGTRLNLETRNGSVNLGRMHGAVVANTHNGSIRAKHVVGALKAITRNGGITVGGVASNFELRNRNGSVRVRLAPDVKLTGKCVAETRNGSVRVSAPKTLSVNLSAKTRNGSVRSDFPLAYSSRKHASGKIGSGGPLLELKTSNGSIYLERR